LLPRATGKKRGRDPVMVRPRRRRRCIRGRRCGRWRGLGRTAWPRIREGETRVAAAGPRVGRGGALVGSVRGEEEQGGAG